MSSVPGHYCGNPTCEHAEKPIQLRYTCSRCKVYLHPVPLGCSEPAPGGADDGNIECREGQGCRERKPAAKPRQKNPATPLLQGTVFASESTPRRSPPRRSPPRRSPRIKATDSLRRSPRLPTAGSSSSVARLPLTLKKKAIFQSRKRGPKKGATRKDRSKEFWYALCAKRRATLSGRPCPMWRFSDQ
jgi:hypothetical protein